MDRDTDEINLLEYWGVLVKRKKLIGCIVGGCFVASIILAFILPKKYVSTTSIMPPQEDSGMASAMMSSLPGGLGSLAGGFLGMKSPADLWVGILSSQSVRDAIIERFKLKEFYGQGIIPAIKAKLFDSTISIEDTRKKLDKAIEIAKSDSEIISISVEDADPEKAAQIANAFVEELDKVNQAVVVTGGKRSRMFLEKRLVIAKVDLAEAEDKLRAFQEKNKAINLDEQAKVIIESIGVVKGQLIAKEVEYETLLSYASRTNPQAELLKTQVDELKKKLVELEDGFQAGAGSPVH
ncbi:MAG: Wzz/FepE/Etk N-terminal domain-containing protein, partial [Deltaproteobacteria bacterium]|nr:Wzz/FepE/Etk N-terminal domain-containing protein [Deltaproteobacteria bacterium]